MKTNRVSVFLMVLGLVPSLIGCGVKYRIVKDWKSRSKGVVEANQPASHSPVYVTALDMGCGNDGTRLKEVRIRNPRNPYAGQKQIIAWYCPKENLYWIRYEEGQGGSLHIQWYGPFEASVKKQRTENRGQKTEVKNSRNFTF